jgi:hypothetical protein
MIAAVPAIDAPVAPAAIVRICRRGNSYWSHHHLSSVV